MKFEKAPLASPASGAIFRAFRANVFDFAGKNDYHIGEMTEVMHFAASGILEGEESMEQQHRKKVLVIGVIGLALATFVANVR